MKKLIILSFILIFSNEVFAQCFSTINSNNFHTAARKTDGSYWVWGGGGAGNLGNSSEFDELSPYLLANTSNWSYIKTNPTNTFAITNGGALWGTGGNSFGCLGVGTSIINYNQFQQIGNQSNWKLIDGAQDFTIALKTNGTLWSWGHNNYHQLGNGNTTDSNVPQQISTDTDWKMIESSRVDNSFAIKNNGTLWGWGDNIAYLLGDDSLFTYLATPTQLNPDTDWRTITCGSGHALAIKTNGTLWSWGNYGQGETGIDVDNLPAGGFDPSAPRQIGTDNNWQSLAAGSSVSMGIKTDGTLWV